MEHVQRCPNNVFNRISSLFTKKVIKSETVSTNDNSNNKISFSSSTFKLINKKIGEGTFEDFNFGKNN